MNTDVSPLPASTATIRRSRSGHPATGNRAAITARRRSSGIVGARNAIAPTRAAARTGSRDVADAHTHDATDPQPSRSAAPVSGGASWEA